MTALVREAVLVEVRLVIQACRDPRDNKFLELAVSANAKIIVSGDKDLLALYPFQGSQIMTPGDFLSKSQ
jgi:uncharacterized protein